MCSITRHCKPAELPRQQQIVESLATSVVQQKEAEAPLRARLLSTLYNFFPTYRFPLLCHVLSVCIDSQDASSGRFQTPHIHDHSKYPHAFVFPVEAQLAELPQWSQQWNLSPSDRLRLFSLVFRLLSVVKRPSAALTALISGLRAVPAAPDAELKGKAVPLIRVSKELNRGERTLRHCSCSFFFLGGRYFGFAAA